TMTFMPNPFDIQAAALRFAGYMASNNLRIMQILASTAVHAPLMQAHVLHLAAARPSEGHAAPVARPRNKAPAKAAATTPAKALVADPAVGPAKPAAAPAKPAPTAKPEEAEKPTVTAATPPKSAEAEKPEAPAKPAAETKAPAKPATAANTSAPRRRTRAPATPPAMPGSGETGEN
ncbi:hypothetical protein AB9K41_29315, partial [Cribrihabitans sp. XS_ASV171]